LWRFFPLALSESRGFFLIRVLRRCQGSQRGQNHYAREAIPHREHAFSPIFCAARQSLCALARRRARVIIPPRSVSNIHIHPAIRLATATTLVSKNRTGPGK